MGKARRACGVAKWIEGPNVDFLLAMKNTKFLLIIEIGHCKKVSERPFGKTKVNHHGEVRLGRHKAHHLEGWKWKTMLEHTNYGAQGRF